MPDHTPEELREDAEIITALSWVHLTTPRQRESIRRAAAALREQAERYETYESVIDEYLKTADFDAIRAAKLKLVGGYEPLEQGRAKENWSKP